MILCIPSNLVLQKHVSKILKVSHCAIRLLCHSILRNNSAICTHMSGVSLITDYMVEKLGIHPSKIDDLSNLLYKNYGTTMAGLRVCFLIIIGLFPLLNSWNTRHPIIVFVSFSIQAIGYDFDYDEYHR